MMRMKNKATGLSKMLNGTSVGGGGGDGSGEGQWEMRPGGMLVQKRNPDSDQNRVPPPIIGVRVKYGSIYHQVSISSQASFGELKKMLSGPTGLHHQDQKLFFKSKERDSNAFLDIAGVKDKSKVVLVEDHISQEKRYLEMRKNAKMEKATKTISDISLEVDRLAGQVSALESVISKGGKVAEKNVINLIEQLMNQLLKLDGIVGDGDVKLKRKMQVKRVQKYVETLDMLKIKNSMPGSDNGSNVTMEQPSPLKEHPKKHSDGHVASTFDLQKSRRSNGHSTTQVHQQQQQQRHSASGGVVITTQWETFDSVPATSNMPPASNNNNSVQPHFNWDLL